MTDGPAIDRTLADQLDHYMVSLPGAWLDRPFSLDVDVYKAGEKMFALMAQRFEHLEISLKVEPGFGVVLRDNYPTIGPGYHLNKKHWITVQLDGSLTLDELIKLVDHSYERVRLSMTKAQRSALVSPKNQ